MICLRVFATPAEASYRGLLIPDVFCRGNSVLSGFLPRLPDETDEADEEEDIKKKDTPTHSRSFVRA